MEQVAFKDTGCLDTIDHQGPIHEIRVLAVDDEPDVIDTIVELMQDFGFEIIGSCNPAGALDLVKQYRPDVILLDIMMPEMDGYEFAGRIMSDNDTRQIPIVYLTSKEIRDDLCRSFAQGGTMYVKKPFLAQELADSLRIAVSLAEAF